VNKGGGAFESTLNNCIVYFNTAGFSGTNYEGGTLNHCCTTPFAGYGNLTGDPQFVDVSGWANLRLRFNSPCIDTAENSYAPGPKDLDGNQRVSGGKVDIGAYEFQFTDQEVPHANVGSEVVKSGEHGCLPVYLESSDELTDLAVTFESAQGLSISSASPVGTEVQSAVVDRLNSNQAVLRVKAKPGQVLRGPKHVANVCFALWSGQPSAFLPLQVVSVRGLRPDAVAVNNNVIEGGSGRVVAIGNEPLLEMTTVTGNTLLTVYGQPASLLLVESKPVLDGDPQSWQPAFTVEIPSTNLWQTISLEPTNQTMFYRARSQ
jgi:hypothetical protein